MLQEVNTVGRYNYCAVVFCGFVKAWPTTKLVWLVNCLNIKRPSILWVYIRKYPIHVFSHAGKLLLLTYIQM